MFKVYEGLTIGENYDADAEFTNPMEALSDLKGREAGLMVIQQDNDAHTYTVLYVKVGDNIFDCIKGETV
jgi:hypothetical protein